MTALVATARRQVPTGPCGIRIQGARLEVRFAKGAAVKIELAAVETLEQKAKRARANGGGGKPKPLPWWQISTESVRGKFRKPTLWRTVYLGNHYGLACADLSNGLFPLVGQWNRKEKTVTGADALGTLTMRYAINAPDLVSSSGGSRSFQGYTAAFQYKNRVIICAKPPTDKDAIMSEAGGSCSMRPRPR